MRADQYLVHHGHFDTRARAQAAIAAGCVRVDGQIIDKASRSIPDGAHVEAEAAHPWVSRAALKLAAGIDAFAIDPSGRFCLDVGASTGGFSEVLLARGARHVIAVDVGHGQLHPRLKGDPRLTSLEGMDARALTPAHLSEAPDLVVCDASFIGLMKVLPAALALAAAGAQLVALFKPQFEVGRSFVGKGGVVRDAAAAARALETVVADLRAAGWTVRGAAPSPVTGSDGNQETLVHAVKSA